MKRILSFFALSLLLGISLSKAQIVPNSGAPLQPCDPGSTVCIASGWAPSYHYISSQKMMGPSYPWVDGTIPPPPSGSLTWQGGVGKMVFMSIYSAYYGNKSVTGQMTGLVPGKTYKLRYYIMSSRVKFPHRKSGYGTEGWLYTPGTISGDRQTFTPGVNTNKWIQKELVFKAKTSTQELTFRNFTTDKLGGVINLDLKGAEWLTEVGANQKLSSEWLTNESLMKEQDISLDGSSANPIIFPNPASKVLNLNIEDWGNVKNIAVVNATTGSVVYKSASKNASSINVEGFPAGTYSVIITSADGTMSKHRVSIAK